MPIIPAKPRSPRIDRSHPLARGLVSCYPFAEGSGSKILDVARGLATTGTDGTEGWVQTKIGPSLQLTTDAQYFVCPETGLPYGRSSRTVAFLFRLDSWVATHGWAVPVAYGTWGGYSGLAVEVSGTQTSPSYQIGLTSYTEDLLIPSYGLSPGDGLFHLFIGTVTNGSDPEPYTLYCDRDQSYTDTSHINTVAGGGLYIGNAPSLVNPTRMTFGMLAFWNRVLSPRELYRLQVDPFAFLRVRPLPIPRPFLGFVPPSVATLAVTLAADTASGSATAAAPPAATATLAATPAISPSLTATADIPPASIATLAAIVSTTAISLPAVADPPAPASGTTSIAFPSTIPTFTATASVPSTCTASLSLSFSGASAAYSATANAPPAATGTVTMTTATVVTATAVAGAPGVDLSALAVGLDGVLSSLSATAQLANQADGALAGFLASDVSVLPATFLQSPNASVALAATLAGVTGPVAATTPWRQPVRAKPSAPRLARKHPLARGLVAGWLYSRGMTVLPDRVGSNPVTLTGTTIGSGPQGPLPTFASSASAVTARAFDFERTQPFTVSLWVILNQVNGRQVFLTNQGGGSKSQGWEVGFAINAPDPNPKGFYLSLSSNKSSGNLLEQVSQIVPVPGRPYHVTWTYDGTSSVVGVKCYANGYYLPHAIPTNNNLTASTLSNTQLLWAQDRYATWYPYAGLGDVLIWNRALSEVEVAQLAADPVAPLRPRFKRFFLGIARGTIGTLGATVSGFTTLPTAHATVPPAADATLTGPMFDLSAAGTGAAALPGIADSILTLGLGADVAAATATHTTPGSATASLASTLDPAVAASTSTATVPPSSTATGAATLTGAACAATATASVPGAAVASTATTLAADSAALSATAVTPASATATGSVTLAGAGSTLAATATTPAPAIASCTRTLAGDAAAGSATAAAAPASTASLSATLTADSATCAATAVDPPGIYPARPGAMRRLAVHPRARNLVAAWCDPAGKLLLRDIVGLNPLSLTNTTAGSSPRGALHVFGATAFGDSTRMLELARNQPFTIALSVSFNALAARQTLVTNQSVSGFYTGWEVGFTPALPGSKPGFYLDLSNNKNTSSYLEQGAFFTPATSRVYRVAWTYDGSGLAAGVRTYVDGLELGRPVASRDNLAGSTTSGWAPRLARDRMAGNQFAGQLGDILVWTRTLRLGEIQADALDPFAPVRPRQRRIWADVPSSGTGTAVLTLGAATASATATTTVPDAATATLAVTLAATTAAYTAVESTRSDLASTLEDLTASGSSTVTDPASATATLAATFADTTAVTLANGALSTLALTADGVTAAFTSLGTVDATATLGATVNLGFTPLAGFSAVSSTATLAATLASTSGAFTAVRTLAPPSTATLAAAVGPFTAAGLGTGSARSTTALALAGDTATAAALASTPPTSAATLSVALAPATSALTATHTAPASATATTATSLAGVGSTLTAIAQKASVGSVTRTLANTVATATGTAAVPGASVGSALATLTSLTAAGTATHTAPGSATATAAVTAADLASTLAATATVPTPATASTSMTVGPATIQLAALSVNTGSTASVATDACTAEFTAEATVPPESAAVGLVWLAGESSSITAGAYPPSAVRAHLATQLADIQSRSTASPTILAEVRGRFRFERAWQQVKRLLGTHIIALERMHADFAQGIRGGPETEWEPVPGYSAIEAIITMTDATIEDSGQSRQGRRRGKILTRTPLPTLGPNFRFLFSDPYTGTRYFNCTPERNLAQAGELWAVGVEEYP